MASAAPTPGARAGGQGEHRGDDQQASRQRERARALAEEEDRRGDREQRAAAARERVDDRQVALLVGVLQGREVADVQQPRARHEAHAGE